MKHSEKRYACTKCGHVVLQKTNHYGQTYSWGHFNTCEKCPPHAKFPEYGGSTVWEYKPATRRAWPIETPPLTLI